MTRQRGTCHCGAVAFTANTDLDDTVICNCSFCIRRSPILQKVSATDFELLRGEDDLGRYGNRSFSDHFFCQHCGIHVFTRLREDYVVICVACLSNVDLDALAPRVFNGAEEL